MSKSQVIAMSGGGDYDDIIREISREQDVAKGLGVTLDKDLDLTIEEGQLELDLPEVKQVSKTKKRSKK